MVRFRIEILTTPRRPVVHIQVIIIALISVDKAAALMHSTHDSSAYSCKCYYCQIEPFKSEPVGNTSLPFRLVGSQDYAVVRVNDRISIGICLSDLPNNGTGTFD